LPKQAYVERLSFIGIFWIFLNYTLTIYFKKKTARHWWLMPIILATQEAEIRRTLFKASQSK
jgi:hypothetical protein